MMFINLSGAPGELTAVREIGVVMPNPIGSAVARNPLGPVGSRGSGRRPAGAKPLVDQFGQWMGDDWPGQGDQPRPVASRMGRRGKSAREAASSPDCRYGGYEGTKAKATGFFRVEKIEGKWWFVDPDGHLFLSVGSDSIGTSASTSTQGREQLFAALPPADLPGGRGGGRGGASFYTWNMVRRFGTDWSAKWVDLTVAAHVRLGLQHGRELVRPTPRERAPHSLCRHAARLGNRDRSHGRARCLFARVRPEHRPRGRPAVRPAQRRPLCAGIFPGQRTALAGA